MLGPSLRAWGLQVREGEGQLQIGDFYSGPQQPLQKGVLSDRLLAPRVVVLSLLLCIISLLCQPLLCPLTTPTVAQIRFKWHPHNTCWIKLIHKVWVWGEVVCLCVYVHMRATFLHGCSVLWQGSHGKIELSSPSSPVDRELTCKKTVCCI